MNDLEKPAGTLSPQPRRGPDADDRTFVIEVERLKHLILANLQAERPPDADPIADQNELSERAGPRQPSGGLASLLFDQFQRNQLLGCTPSEDLSEPPLRAPEPARIPLPEVGPSSLAPPASVRMPRPFCLPVVGDEVCGFKLLAELGRGAFARVFLAEQSALGGRPVVVKVSAIQGNEPQTLAQLQHTHIVPIYSLHDSEELGLRLVCMPYFRGATLAQVLLAVRHGARQPSRGKDLVHSLHALSDPHGASSSAVGYRPIAQSAIGQNRPSDSRQPIADSRQPIAVGEVLAEGDAEGPLKLFNQSTFVEASAWIVARIAEALQHAHNRGILHRDLKPSNILLTAEGQPMLLDFNLAQKTESAGEAAAVLGGTVAYMAPEHLRAVAGHDPVAARQVDHRADIYSLGMVFFEMLAGRRPFEQRTSRSAFPALINALAVERGKTTPSIRALRRDIPWSLESILRKCLAPATENRYQRAEQLAEDLHCFLENRPLKHAPELSLKERARKWTRRHPRLASWGTLTAVAVLLLCITAVASLAAWDQRQIAAVASTREHFDKGVIRALCVLNAQTARPEGGDHRILREHMEQGVRICEETLNLYGLLSDPRWQERPPWQRLDATNRRRLAGDMRLLLVTLADARFYLAQRQGQAVPPEVLRTCLDHLQLAESLPDLESFAALFEQRATYLEALSLSPGDELAEEAERARRRAAAYPPRTARDFYLLALGRIRARRLEQAVPHLKKAVELDPRDYWVWFRLGLCYAELRDYTAAAGAYDVCTALWPEFPWAYLNRGAARARLGRYPEALADYDRALAYDPNFVLLYFNRAMVRQDLEDHAAALQDLDRASELGQRDFLQDGAFHAVRGKSLEALARHAEADEAFREALRLAPEDPTAYLMRGYALAARRPEQSLRDFNAVLKRTPDSLLALYGKGMVLCDPLDRIEEAIVCFDQALERDASFVPALRGRAILRARQGRFEAAWEDAERSVRLEPSGVNYYNAACVQALLAQVDPAAGSQAVRCLREAFRLGYGRDRFERDADLTPVRAHADYRQLLDELRGGRN